MPVVWARQGRRDVGGPGRLSASASLTDELIELGGTAGLDAVGIAEAARFTSALRVLHERRDAGLHGGMGFTFRNPERSTDPARFVPGARSLVVGALSYRRRWLGELARAAQHGAALPENCAARPLGRVAQYAWADHYATLGAKLDVVAERLRHEGWHARVAVDDNALVDKEAAVRAGIGWYGKNTLVLLPDRGSSFVLGSVVTDAPLVTGGTGLDDGCGSCQRCIHECPTGAIVAPGVLDARRCLAWLLEAPGTFPRELRAALGNRIYGCDECQSVCPVNRRAERDDPAPLARDGERPWRDLVEMITATDEDLLEMAGRWYVPQRQARYLRRNALVALGNTADGNALAVDGALRRALTDADPVVRSHAVWATARLGRHDLLDGLAGTEGDVAVLEELDAAKEPVRP